MGYPDEGQVVSSVLLTPVSSMFQINATASSRFYLSDRSSMHIEEALNIDPSAEFSVRMALLRKVAVFVNSPEPIILSNIQSQVLRSIKKARHGG